MNTAYKTIEEKRQIIARFNLIDDIFFQKVIDDISTCEELLRVLLEDESIKVVEVNTQKSIRNVASRSVVLDALCKASDGSLFNVEVQRNDNGNLQKRMRYYVSNLDTMITEAGIGFEDIPDVYAIMICEFDIFKLGRTLYHIDRRLAENNTIQDNGIHEIYVNAHGKDPGTVTELMRYMLDSNGYNKYFPNISKRVQYFKDINEVDESMSSVVEELIDEGKNIGKAEVLKVLGVSEAEYQKKLAEQQQEQ